MMVDYYCIQHEESTCEFHVRRTTSLPQSNRNTVVRAPLEPIQSIQSERETNLVNASTKGFFFDDEEMDEEDDGSEQSDNSFIAPSGDDDDDSNDEEVEDDDEVCCICNDGGHMIVCDGGDQFPHGCGGLFHLGCIQRSILPPGDWICQDCTNSNLNMIPGLYQEVGIEGYEFPSKKVVTAKIPRRKKLCAITGTDGNASSDNECSSVQSPNLQVLGRKNGKQVEKENDYGRCQVNDESINDSDVCCIAEKKQNGKRKLIIDTSSDDE
jgi:hypothetical protein